MNKCHIYIDGSWLYTQCTGSKVLGKKTVYGKIFINYKNLVDLIVSEVRKAKGEQIDKGELHYFTSIIKDIPRNNIKFDGEYFNLETMKLTSKTKLQTASKAHHLGGFEVTNFEIGFRPWMPKAIKNGTYQEKMVDTAIVAKFVMNSLKKEYSADYHAILSGDLDMLAAFQEVLMNKDSSPKILLVTIDPNQWDQKDNQVSKDLADFQHFVVEPIYLDRFIQDIMQGEKVLQCQGCVKYFDAKTSNIRFCQDCNNIHKKNNPQRDSSSKRITRTQIGKATT